MLVAWPGSFWVSVGSWNPPGNELWVLWALHCCLGLEAGLEPGEKGHELGKAMVAAAPQRLSPAQPTASPSLDQHGFSSSGERLCGGLGQARDSGEAEASPHSSCCCCC